MVVFWNFSNFTKTKNDKIMLEIGQKAPEFCLPDTNGQEVCLKDFNGKWVVLYFYPKDNTSGCTKEAIDFTELKNEFEKLGAQIIGISKDSQQSHQKFVQKYNLGITLLSDTEKQVHRAYGAWGLKKQYGKETEGTIRSTFIIDPQGNIVHTWYNVKVRQKRKSGEVKHAEIVLNKLKELMGKE